MKNSLLNCPNCGTAIPLDETFVLMPKHLTKEKNAASKAFNQREKQHETVLKACFGVIGDLQGIAGQDLKSLEEIEMKALPAGEEDED